MHESNSKTLHKVFFYLWYSKFEVEKTFDTGELFTNAKLFTRKTENSFGQFLKTFYFLHKLFTFEKNFLQKIKGVL